MHYIHLHNLISLSHLHYIYLYLTIIMTILYGHCIPFVYFSKSTFHVRLMLSYRIEVLLCLISKVIWSLIHIKLLSISFCISSFDLFWKEMMMSFDYWYRRSIFTLSISFQTIHILNMHTFILLLTPLMKNSNHKACLH